MSRINILLPGTKQIPYYSGDVIDDAAVELTCNKTISVKNITLLFRGVEQIEQDDNKEESVIFEIRKALGENIVLVANTHLFPFKFEIPSTNTCSGVPSSFDSTNPLFRFDTLLPNTPKASIFYEIRAIVEPVGGSGIMEAKKIIPVRGTQLTRDLIRTTSPPQESISHSYEAGTITASMGLNEKIIYSGQEFQVHINIFNGTNQDIDKLNIVVRRYVAYYSMGEKIHEECHQLTNQLVNERVPGKSELHKSLNVVATSKIESTKDTNLVTVDFEVCLSIHANEEEDFLSVSLPVYMSTSEELAKTSKPTNEEGEEVTLRIESKKEGDETQPEDAQPIKNQPEQQIEATNYKVEEEEKLDEEDKLDEVVEEEMNAPARRRPKSPKHKVNNSGGLTPQSTPQVLIGGHVSQPVAPLSVPQRASKPQRKGREPPPRAHRSASPMLSSPIQSNEHPTTPPSSAFVKQHSPYASPSGPGKTHFGSSFKQSPMHKEHLNASNTSMDPDAIARSIAETKRRIAEFKDEFNRSASQSTLARQLKQAGSPQTPKRLQDPPNEQLSPQSHHTHYEENAPHFSPPRLQEPIIEQPTEQVSPRNGRTNPVLNTTVDEKEDDEPIVEGEFDYPNNSRYVGQFYKGMKHGKGKMYYNDGTIYSGDWLNDQRSGWGVYSSSKYTYDGEFENDQKHGRGIIIYTDGEKYEGNWLAGYPSGHGTYIFKDGSRYVGEFKRGLRHGHGTLNYSDNATVYDGEWVNDKKHGKACITFVNGRYLGQMVNDMKEGQGRYEYKTGDVYEGNWKNNKKHGNGVYYTHDGGFYEGTWERGVKHGMGILHLPSGSKYQERWSMGRLIRKKKLDEGNY